MVFNWENHRVHLKTYINKQLDNADVTEDILQDVYIKACENLKQLNETANLKSWLYSITRNTIIDYYRKRMNYEELSDDIAQEDKDIIEENHKAIAICIKLLVHELPDKYRIPLELSELDGMTQKDVALKLGLSVSGAKSRVQRGRQKLRDLLWKYCEFEISNAGITNFWPKTPQGQKYYDDMRKINP